MASSLQRRLRRLEDASGEGGECPRCSGTVVVYVNDELDSVTKDGRKLTPDEALAFEGEEAQDGRCRVCCAKGQEITIGGP